MGQDTNAKLDLFQHKVKTNRVGPYSELKKSSDTFINIFCELHLRGGCRRPWLCLKLLSMQLYV